MRLMILALALACPSFGALAVVNAIAAENTGGSSATLATGTQSHTTGNLLSALVGFHDTCSAHTVTVTNTAGASFTQIGAGYQTSVFLCMYSVYLENITGNASDVITATFDSSVLKPYMVVIQISGAATSFSLDTSAVGNSTTAGPTTITSGNFSTATANEIVIGGAGQYFAATFTAGNIAGSAATIPTITNAGTFTSVEYRILSATVSTQTADINEGSGGQYAAIMVAAFRQATASTPVRRRVSVIQ